MRKHSTLLLLVCTLVILGMIAGAAVAGAAPPQKPNKPDKPGKGGGKGGSKGGGGGGGGGTPVTVAFADGAGDKIQSDGGGAYAGAFISATSFEGVDVNNALHVSKSSERTITLIWSCPAHEDAVSSGTRSQVEGDPGTEPSPAGHSGSYSPHISLRGARPHTVSRAPSPRVNRGSRAPSWTTRCRDRAQVRRGVSR